MARANDLAIFLAVILACSSCQTPQAQDGAAERQAATEQSSNQLFLLSQLRALLAFKDDRDFHAVGFSPGHRFHSWLQAVEARRADKELSWQEAEALGHLEQLGLEYCRLRGREGEYTTFAKQVIEEHIAAPHVAAPVR